jgi:hypothetical protein
LNSSHQSGMMTLGRYEEEAMGVFLSGAAVGMLAMALAFLLAVNLNQSKGR